MFVLCLVLLFSCKPVQLLETGYEYPGNDLIEKDRLYEDLKCAYLFSGLTHLLLTQVLLICPAHNAPTKLMAGNVSYYKNTVKYQIASLYIVNVRIGSLWLLHLYISMIPGLTEYSQGTRAVYVNLVMTHKYVIKKLRTDLTRCRKGNAYDSFDEMINSKPNLTHDHLREMVDINDSMASRLLDKNKICSASYNEKFIETTKIKRLLMNNIGTRTVFIKDLMHVFNVQVSWSDITKVRLEKSYLDARILDWSTDNLQNIKTYYTMIYSFVKIIMFRLTVKHMAYLNKYSPGSDDYVHYVQQWYGLVEKFAIMLNLTNDLHVKNLLTAINNLLNGTEKIDSVVSYVQVILQSLCLPLGCRATEPFDTDNSEFRIPYETSNKYIVMGLENISTSRVPIEYNSLENTKMFLLYLDRVFEYVDFGIIGLLMQYIDEIKLEND